MTIADPALRAAVDDYAEAIIDIAVRERQIADIDKEVLGTEGRLIGRVTELLREVSARRGRVLSAISRGRSRKPSGRASCSAPPAS